MITSYLLFLADEATPAAAAATPAPGQNEYVHQIITSHFAWGLALGLILVLVTWIMALAKRGELRREVRRLREHLNTQMDITQRGNSAMKAELEMLKTQNENLRVAVKEWQTKPGRGEMRQLSIYDRAIRILNQNAPGFSPVWEKAVKESEAEFAESESGSMGSVLRRAFRPFVALGNGPRTEKATGGSYEDAGGPPASHND